MADVLEITSAIPERETGFEPAVFSLARRRCTTQLLPRYRRMLTPRRWCAETQDRTADTAIFSRVLYQLSYLGVKRPVFYNSADRLSSNRLACVHSNASRVS